MLSLKIISFYILCSAPFLNAVIGCMEKGNHNPRELFDNKEYHLVTCTCECEKRYKILSNRAMCMQCKHFRIPRSLVFVRLSE